VKCFWPGLNGVYYSRWPPQQPPQHFINDHPGPQLDLLGHPAKHPTTNQPPATTHLPYHCTAAFVPLSVLQRFPQSAHHSCPRQDVIFAQGRNGTARSPSFFPFSQPFIQPRTHINGPVRQVHCEKSYRISITYRF